MRKITVTESAFKALELYADNVKNNEICQLLGCACSTASIKTTFFRIMNFGYDGVIPQNITPKYSAEELCKKVFARTNYIDVTFKYHTPVTKQQFLSDSFVCGCKNNNKTITADSDIRCLDLSVVTFNTLLHHFNYSCMPRVPFTIRSLVSFSDEEIFRIHYLGKKGIAEIKEELAKHGFELGREQPSLNTLISAAQREVGRDSEKGEPSIVKGKDKDTGR